MRQIWPQIHVAYVAENERHVGLKFCHFRQSNNPTYLHFPRAECSRKSWNNTVWPSTYLAVMIRSDMIRLDIRYFLYLHIIAFTSAIYDYMYIYIYVSYIRMTLTSTTSICTTSFWLPVPLDYAWWIYSDGCFKRLLHHRPTGHGC